MATFSDSHRSTDTRSGGKIVPKRRRRPTTSYDRRPAPPGPEPKSPNWLTSVIFPATRRIALGAAKILSLVFDTDNSDDSSFSSSDSEAADGTSRDESDYDELENLCGSEKDHGAPSDAMRCISEVRQLSTWKNERTDSIEKLLMCESYSREECDRLTQIINSRVVDSTVGVAEAGVTTGTPDKTIQNDADDISGKAIIEARKWLKEKKVISSSLSDGADVSCGLESVAVQHIDNEVASPVDMAKAYMKSRPPWASPFADHIEIHTPSPLKNQLCREGTLFPVGDQYLSSVKKRTSLASSSWNIQEEIRRVRLKATEDLLQSPSRRIHLSSLALSPRYGQDSLIANVLTISKECKGNETASLTRAKPINLSMNDTAMGSSNGEIPAMEIGSGLANEGVMSEGASFEQYQDSQPIKNAGECAASKSTDPANLDIGMEQNDVSQSACVNGSPVVELRNINGRHANGLLPSQASTLDKEDIHNEILEQNPNSVKGFEKEKTTGNIDEECELLTEASIEVPIVHETNCIANLYQGNSIMCNNDDSSWMLTQSDKRKVVVESDAAAVKQEVGSPTHGWRRAGKNCEMERELEFELKVINIFKVMSIVEGQEMRNDTLVDFKDQLDEFLVSNITFWKAKVN